MGRIVGVVCSHVQRAAYTQQMSECSNEVGSNETTDTLPLLGPRVGKEHSNGRERSPWNSRHELDDVTLHNTHVPQAAALDGLEHRGDSRSVHVDTDHGFAGSRVGQFDQRFASAESDVDHDIAGPRAAAEDFFEDQFIAIDGDPPSLNRPFVRNSSRRREAEPTRFERTLWGMRDASGYRHGTTMVPVANVQG